MNSCVSHVTRYLSAAWFPPNAVVGWSCNLSFSTRPELKDRCKDIVLLVKSVLAYMTYVEHTIRSSQAADVHPFSTFIVRALYPFFHRFAINCEVVFKLNMHDGMDILCMHDGKCACMTCMTTSTRCSQRMLYTCWKCCAH